MEKLNRNISCSRRKMQAGQLHRKVRSAGRVSNPRRSGAGLDRREKMQLATGCSDDGSLQSCDHVHTPSKIAGSRLRVLPGSCRRTRQRTAKSRYILRHLRREIKKCYMSFFPPFRLANHAMSSAHHYMQGFFLAGSKVSPNFSSWATQ